MMLRKVLTTGWTKLCSSAEPAWLLFGTSPYWFDFQPSGAGSISYLCPSRTGYMEKSWQLIKPALCHSSRNYGWGHKSFRDLCGCECPSPGPWSLKSLHAPISLTTGFSEDWSSSPLCWWRWVLAQDGVQWPQGFPALWNAFIFAQSLHQWWKQELLLHTSLEYSGSSICLVCRTPFNFFFFF